jgi:hypothetical protein
VELNEALLIILQVNEETEREFLKYLERDHQENIILSEVSLAQKTKNLMFSLICGH